MACGLAAIVSEGVACAGDLVLPGDTGEVFPVGSDAELVDRIARLASDHEYRNRVSRNARARVARFDVGVAAAGTLRAIQALAADRRARSGRPGPPEPAIRRVP
jgi:glycosyltransferase involved in cell wall biosynthesis